MRFLEPSVTIILTSHMKPFLQDAIDSLMAQTRKDFHVLLIDSGQWFGKNDEVSQRMREIYTLYGSNPQIEWYFTGENENTHKEVCMVARAFNKVVEGGLIRGKYFCTFYDDDIYYPQFVEKMAGFLDAHPESHGVMCSENRTMLNRDNTRTSTPALMVNASKSGQSFDCAVDGMQIMMRKTVLDKIEKPWINEDVLNCSHSDGVFLNKVGAVVDKIDFIPDILAEHRNTIYSTFTPTK